jgi:hypothetical protein
MNVVVEGYVEMVNAFVKAAIQGSIVQKVHC